MKHSYFVILFILIFISTTNHAQFHNFDFKYGIQGHLLIPRTEFDSDSYKLSLLGRGFLRKELNSFLEIELGVGIAELNGEDFDDDSWTTFILPTDLRLVFSPMASENTSPYLYSGLSLLRWEISDFPTSVAENESEDSGWNIGIPIGFGIEIKLSEEILFDANAGYIYSMTDDLNYYNSPTAEDGYINLGMGLTFVMGGSLTDIDNDGLSQSFEDQIGTDPNLRDTDQDNLHDGEEVKIYKTDPLSIDTDKDGLNDYEEIRRYNSDPLSQDTDGDNIIDGEEVNIYGSDPNKKDTDLDKLTDGYEVNVYNTNPIRNDTDNDNLFDNEEIHKYKTDPNKIDTDGDGISDGEEIIKLKTDPLVKDAKKENILNDNKLLYINSAKSVILKGVTFETDKAEIKSESETILQKTFLELKNDPTLSIEIRGYTDNVGQTEYNKDLSQQRADAVRIWLVKKGIDALRINAKGYGEENPIADNATLDGKNQNRRIEIIKIK